MACLSQSSWISSLHTTLPMPSMKPTFSLSSPSRPSTFRALQVSASAMGSPKDEISPPNSADTPESPDKPKLDRIKLAFERAKEYKKSLKAVEFQQNSKYPDSQSAGIVGGSDGFVSGVGEEGPKEDFEGVGVAMDKAGEYKQTEGLVGNGRSSVDSENFPEGGDSGKEEVPEALRIALEKAKEYKKNKGKDADDESNEKRAQLMASADAGDGKGEVPEALRVAMEKAKEYKKNKGSIAGSNSPLVNSKLTEGGDRGKEEVPEALRIALEKAKEYKKNKGKVGDDESNEKREQLTASGATGDGKGEVPEGLRVAMEKTEECKKNKGNIAGSSSPLVSSKLTGSDGGRSGQLDNGSTESKIGKKDDLKISSIDFVGLGFADKKKSRGLPAGLVPISDPFPVGDLPEVEILVGDASKFGSSAAAENKTSSEGESDDLYKPKVSTWGVFPRPSNISKTFGGGKTIRPGQALETHEDRAAKEARTKQLVAAYKRKIGLSMDPKLKAECEEALKDGDSMMEMGRLTEALPYYQLVMDKLAFPSELHGLAALQWSICQDSLVRPEKARAVYEKLQSHPNAQVNKKARQLMFSFQAMEMMKEKRSAVSPRNTGYQNYFEAFVEDKEKYASGPSDSEEGALNQAIPYIIFLTAPILLVLLIAARKGI